MIPPFTTIILICHGNRQPWPGGSNHLARALRSSRPRPKTEACRQVYGVTDTVPSAATV